MTESDKAGIDQLKKINNLLRAAQGELWELASKSTPTTRDSLLSVEGDLSDVRFQISIAVKEIEGGV